MLIIGSFLLTIELLCLQLSFSAYSCPFGELFCLDRERFCSQLELFWFTIDSGKALLGTSTDCKQESLTAFVGRQPTQASTHPNTNNLHKQLVQTLSACFLLISREKGENLYKLFRFVLCKLCFYIWVGVFFLCGSPQARLFCLSAPRFSDRPGVMDIRAFGSWMSAPARLRGSLCRTSS